MSARRTSAKDIGRSIRKLRLLRRMTGKQLASRIGSDKGTVSRIEHGQAGLSVERLEKIATALGTGVAELLSESKRPAA